MLSLSAAAAIYARISSDPGGTAAGVRRQVADCQAWARDHGWTVAEVYVDNDTSAYSGRSRPAYRLMLDDIAAGRRDGVIAYNLDRLHRHPRELEGFFDVCKAAAVTNLATVTGQVDLSTHDGQFHARILGAVARKESDDKSRRVTRKHLELALAGRVSGGGSRPYGYAVDRIALVPEEAAIVREIADRLLAGDTLWSIANNLNTRAVPTVTRKEWSVHALRQLALSARISGQRESDGQIVATAVWPPIITPAQTTRLRALLTAPERRTNRAARRYLLAGMLRCAKCHRVLVARPRADGRRRYVCARAPGRPGCGGTFILADDVETLIASAVVHRLDGPGLAASLYVAQDDAAIQARLRSLADDQDQLDALASAYGRREFSLREWHAARTPILERITAANAALTHANGTAALEAVLTHPSGVTRAFSEIPLSRQQAVIKAVLDYATIGPAVRGRNRFDPKRVTPAWRRA